MCNDPVLAENGCFRTEKNGQKGRAWSPWLFVCLFVGIVVFLSFVTVCELFRNATFCETLFFFNEKNFDFLLFRFVSLHYSRFGNRRPDGRPRWRRTLYSLRQFNDVRQSLHDLSVTSPPAAWFHFGTREHASANPAGVQPLGLHMNQL